MDQKVERECYIVSLLSELPEINNRPTMPRDQYSESKKPDTKSHTPHQAATRAIPPSPLKKLKIRISPNPAFCIPVSKATAFAFSRSEERRVGKECRSQSGSSD